jgi:hypothetical protein
MRRSVLGCSASVGVMSSSRVIGRLCFVPQTRLRRDAAIVGTAESGVWRVAGRESPWRLLRRPSGGAGKCRRGPSAGIV